MSAPEGVLARLRAHTNVIGVRARPTRALTNRDVLDSLSKSKRPDDATYTEAQRIAALPTWAPADFEHFDLTSTYRTAKGEQRLRPIQSTALHWAAKVGGLLAPIGVGHGKGLLTIVLPVAMKAQRPVLLLPPAMREPFAREYRKFAPHWQTHPGLRVIPYSHLSVATGADLLNKLQPDLVIADEAHNLRHPTATRTKRLLRYFNTFPSTRFVGLSGTMTRKGLKDYAHLAELALGDGSPLPLDPFELLAWANCIDSDGIPTDSDWEALASGEHFLPASWAAIPFEPDDGHTDRRDLARANFQRRLVTTPGVVATDSASVGASLLFVERALTIPTELADTIRDVAATWCRPDGEEMDSPLAKYRLDAQLSAGFWYRWVWPNNEPDTEWIEKRAAWHRTVRFILKEDREGLDSPLLVTRAVMALRDDEARLSDDLTPAERAATLAKVRASKVGGALAAWLAWDRERHKPTPPTETVWVSDFVIRDAVAWAIECLHANEPGIIWYADNAVGIALRKAGLPVYMAGDTLPADSHNAFVMACSAKAFGTGQNLQAWARNLILSPPSSASDFEQLLGRTHRAGQLADEVQADYYAHTAHVRATLRSAMRQALYIEQTTGDGQRLRYGVWRNPTWQGGENDED